jgi:glycosyltransferase involved in cell wall biosynthesis
MDVDFQNQSGNLIQFSLIIPCKDEQETIGTIISLGLRELPSVTEVIVVVGNSIDKTFENASQIVIPSGNSLKKKLKVIKQHSLGKWNGVVQGIEASSNKHIAIWDADLTVTLLDQRKLLNKYESSYNLSNQPCLVSGNRMKYQEIGAMKFLNFIGNSVFIKVWGLLGGRFIPDLLCGSKVFTKEIIASPYTKLHRFDSYGDLIIFSSALDKNADILFEDVLYKKRNFGKSKMKSFRTGIKFMVFTFVYFIRRSFKR